MLYAIHSLLGRLRRNTRGASAVEYAILVGIIGGLLAVGAQSFGTSLKDGFTSLYANTVVTH